jgi:hypothetical protein
MMLAVGIQQAQAIGAARLARAVQTARDLLSFIQWPIVTLVYQNVRDDFQESVGYFG